MAARPKEGSGQRPILTSPAIPGPAFVRGQPCQPALPSCPGNSTWEAQFKPCLPTKSPHPSGSFPPRTRSPLYVRASLCTPYDMVCLGPREISATISHAWYATLSKETQSQRAFYMLGTMLSLLRSVVNLILMSTIMPILQRRN